LLVIARTIITGVQETGELVGFYEDAYSRGDAEAALYSRWRALGALGKADHVIALCERAGVAPQSTLEVGCGDGALLCELHARGFGGRLCGLEIADAPVAIAAARPAIASAARYDGRRVPAADGAYDLGILSHVLEHVPEPAALLAEVARACRAVVVEVPLEDNWSARRPGKRRHAEEVGHLQRLDRRAARALVRRAGLEVEAELTDALPLSVHRFFAFTALSRTAALGKWATRSALHRLSPALAGGLFTLHYACLCRPAS
jgi:SAM-dependent methyltransferase